MLINTSLIYIINNIKTNGMKSQLKSETTEKKVTKENYDSLVNEVGISRREVESIVKQLKSADIGGEIRTDVVYGGGTVSYCFRRVSSFAIELTAAVCKHGDVVYRERKAYTVANIFPTRVRYFFGNLLTAAEEMEKAADFYAKVSVGITVIKIGDSSVELELHENDNGRTVVAIIQDGNAAENDVRNIVGELADFFGCTLQGIEVRKGGDDE